MDLYETLGITKDASQEEIKKAYQRAAKKNHPDSPDKDDDKWDEISKAYEVLNDPGRKKIYDETGVHNSDHYNMIAETTVAVFMRHVQSSNPIRDAIRAVERENSNNTMAIFENKSAISLIDSLLKRLKRSDKSSVDPIKDALLKKKQDFENKIKSATYVISLMKEVIAELKKYSISDDSPSATAEMLVLRGPRKSSTNYHYEEP